MQLNKILRQARLELGYTQIQLAGLSGISLPSIQNIEKGTGNPAWSTTLALLKTLGLGWRIEREKANWDYLASCGVPLLSEKPRRRYVDPLEFLRELKTACIEIDSDPHSEERLAESLQACLLAIQGHFPTFLKRHLAHFPPALNILAKKPSGRIIKLKRQALSSLSLFL